ncbi:MAG: trypsin-like peptidase domain-containing protein [Clostridia bacterium]|nr:trypsin-like peptidase domain-containing protein [Clostridia bacterium]
MDDKFFLNNDEYTVINLDENKDFEKQNSVYARPRYERQSRKSGFKTYIALVLTTAMVTSAAVGGVLFTKFSNELKKQTALIQKAGIVSNVNNTNAEIENKNIVKTALAKGSPVTEIAKKVGPSIVGIRMTVANQQTGYLSNGLGGSKAEGSGVIISEDGYIMTNYHVVQYADTKLRTSKNTTLEVFLPDKRQAKAKFIGGDSKNDLAVIKIELDNLPVAELGNSSKLEVGETAIAIGNPLGMEFAGSVTVGVVSALNRVVETEDKTMSLIQTDAAINPGNSGGALVNSQGQVIGINTIKISEAGVEGLGFAIPINDAKPIVDQLVMFGYVKGRPLIGISGKEITEVLASQYDLPVGVYIMEVTAGSGADKAGLEKGDILVSIAGKEVKTMKDLDAIKKRYKAGDTVDAAVVRDGVKIILKLTFSEEK